MTDTPRQPDLFEDNPDLAADPILAAAWEQGSGRPVGYDTTRLWARVERDTVGTTAHGAKLPGLVFPGVYSRWTLPRWVGYAVAALVVGFASWQATSKSNNPASATEVKTYTTRPGQRASLTLRDGSHVTIGPATTLHVLTASATTDVEVNGEALFNVNHAAQRPFTVTAYGVTTRVLGTEFVVRSYDSSLVRIAVRDGRVSVQSPSVAATNAAVVTAGEAASVKPNALPTVVPISDLATEFSWATGELVLRDMPLNVLLRRDSKC